MFNFIIRPKLASWGKKRLDEAGAINKKIIKILLNIQLIKHWGIEDKLVVQSRIGRYKTAAKKYLSNVCVGQFP